MKKLLHIIILIFFPLLVLNAQTSADTCLDALAGLPITAAGTFNISTIDGSEFPDPICTDNSSAANGEWYRYTPSGNYYVTVTSDLVQNLGIDTRVHIYSGACGSLTCIAGDDDSGNNGALAVASFNATSGLTYYIAWDNYYSSNGFDFKLIEASGPPPTPTSFTTAALAYSGTDRAVVDMNGDYLDDVVAVSTTNVNINHQQPNGTFVSSNYAISAPYSSSWSLAAGDFDNNGYNDLIWGSSSGVNVIKANSNGTGYSVTNSDSDVFTQRTNFVDLNNDGHLDAFVCHDIGPNVYYINDGSGGLDFYRGAIYAGSCSGDPDPDSVDQIGVPGGLGIYCSGGNYGSVWIDYDNDHDIDLFLAKCGGGIERRTNQLFRNNGDGTYTDDAVTAGLDDPIQTWSGAWADYDNDGDMDCFVGAYSGDPHKMMRNDNAVFTDITATTGLDTFTTTGIEHVAYDFNNDGYVDILSNGKMLINNGDSTFTAYSSGIPSSGSIGDLDDDGFLDVFNGSIRYNDGNANNWLKINPVGVASNKNGIGARIEVASPGFANSQIRDIRSGEGFRYMSSLTAHFGLGADTTIDSITIYWPSGTVDVIVNPSINQSITVVEGETLSLQKSIAEDLIIYPNPTKDYLNINATYGFENAIFSVFDMMGRRVLNSSFSSNKIDVSRLSTGNYILRIIEGGLIKSQKFIKQ